MNPVARILVVDDNEANRDLLTRRLHRLGFQTATADNGLQALTQLAREPFDLMLLDITMPEMDGYQVLARLREDPTLPAVPVVMVSAIDEVDSVVRCLELGAEDYLPKPFNPLILKARVEASLARKALRDKANAHARVLERELEIGREIQTGFLPRQLPQPQGWSLSARFVPARQVAGDFYDAFELPGQRLALVVADVCDKGVGAALYMTLFRSLIRAIAPQAGDEPSDAIITRTLGFANDYIATVHEHANMFATAFLGVLEPATGRFTYANAGHDAPLLLRRDAHSAERLMPTGLALGLMAQRRVSVRELELQTGDRLLAYTDGLVEAQPGQVALSETDIVDLMRPHRSDAQALLSAVLQAVAPEDSGDRVQADDITLLALVRTAPGR